jgi:hypothetical protein
MKEFEKFKNIENFVREDEKDKEDDENFFLFHFMFFQ